jgi:hypothetical protein
MLSWRISLALAAVPAGIVTLAALFLPDTPNSLLELGLKSDASLTSAVITGLINNFATLVFVFTVDMLGRRINVSVNMLFTFVIAQAFLTMLCHLKFAASSTSSRGGSSSSPSSSRPETNNMPIEEMVLVWKLHWFSGKFVADEEARRVLIAASRKTAKFHLLGSSLYISFLLPLVVDDEIPPRFSSSRESR